MKVKCEMCGRPVEFRSGRDAQFCCVCRSVIDQAYYRNEPPMRSGVDWEDQAARLDENERMNGQAKFYQPRD